MYTFNSQRKFTSPQITLLLALTVLISTGIHSAQALEIKNGKWGITTEVNVPMSAEPIVEYMEECMEGDFDPMAELLEQDITVCEILSSQDSDNLLEMTMQCTIADAGTMKGEMFFEVFGDTANGRVDMTMDFGGMTMNMDSTWSGEYLGACSP